MGKDLREMTNEELWRLFPIKLESHNAEWGAWFSEEKARIAPALPANARISHMGSTAIPGIWAKPTIDIMAEVAPSRLTAAADSIRALGYRGMSGADFNRGYTSEGFAERVYHLHLRVFGDNRELYFRDYLTGDKKAAAEYQRLKLELWKKFEFDRDAYTDAKGEFVNALTEKALAKYPGRHERIIAACGNDCGICPRHMPRTKAELDAAAILWQQVGYRDRIETAEEMACAGCAPENACRYGIAACEGGRGCKACAQFPCEKAEDCFAATERFITDNENLRAAFYNKKLNIEDERE